MHNCEKLRDEIWEAVEAGEIPRDLLLQLEDCGTCCSELAKAESAMQGFETFRAVDVPDCSSLVMTQIASRNGHKRPIWAYSGGFALLLLIGAMLTLIYWPRNARPGKSMAKATIHHVAPDRTAHSSKIVEQHKIADAEKSPKLVRKHTKTLEIARTERIEHKSPVCRKPRTLPLPEPPLVKKNEYRQQYAEKQVNHPEQASQPEGNEPIIAIVVMDASADQAAQSNEASSYGYTQTNPETGDVTTCSVKRSGEAVEIRMKMEPANKEIPGEGSLEHENRINA